MTPGPYPGYRDVGLAWLQQVPEHWTVRRGKELFRRVDQRSASGEEELLTVSSVRGVVPRHTANVTMFKAESYVGYKLCWPDDLVINSLWAWAGGLGVSHHHGIVSSAYGVYRLRDQSKYSPAFLHELVRSDPFQWELQVRSKGIWTSRLQLTDESFFDAPFVLPPSDEQAAIVRYLNYMEHRIWRYIAAKRKLIGLLEAQKQAIICQAVTGQIDVRTGKPYPIYKESGAEWPGQVPEEWEVLRLKRISHRHQNGSTPPMELANVYFADDGIPWYTPPSIGEALAIGPPTRFVTNRAIDEGRVRLISAPALAVSVIGNVGRSALLVEAGTTNQQITCFELDQGLVDARFIALQFRLLVPVLVASASSATIAILDTNLLRNTRIAMPANLKEQSQIVACVSRQTAEIELGITSARHEMDLLREYRTRLFADVLTGKLDVRDAAAQLPDEIDDEALEDVEAFAEDDQPDEEGDLDAAPEEAQA